jgi:hypothetical protein
LCFQRQICLGTCCTREEKRIPVEVTRGILRSGTIPPRPPVSLIRVFPAEVTAHGSIGFRRQSAGRLSGPSNPGSTDLLGKSPEDILSASVAGPHSGNAGWQRGAGARSVGVCA